MGVVNFFEKDLCYGIIRFQRERPASQRTVSNHLLEATS